MRIGVLRPYKQSAHHSVGTLSCVVAETVLAGDVHVVVLGFEGEIALDEEQFRCHLEESSCMVDACGEHRYFGYTARKIGGVIKC